MREAAIRIPDSIDIKKISDEIVYQGVGYRHRELV